ncbi:MAG: hypothetical protein COX43_02185 [Parcubacteria group bacterium CG23_combo_of_CG06-09_8_20_14_all_35_9]|nr:MAG: hypothetical protein COX43_02185 [Parcubacteria group bacterium CG23_combo_of_CG06-09_8_20_14_all_35_9]
MTDGLRGPLTYGLYKRGSVLHIPDFKFPTGPPRGKYCILMEDFTEEKDTAIIILTTTNLKYKDKKWSVLVPKSATKGFPAEDVLIDCNNWHKLPKDRILQKKCRFVSYLKEEIINKINKALELANKIPPEIIIRIKPSKV